MYTRIMIYYEYKKLPYNKMFKNVRNYVKYFALVDVQKSVHIEIPGK